MCGDYVNFDGESYELEGSPLHVRGLLDIRLAKVMSIISPLHVRGLLQDLPIP